MFSIFLIFLMPFEGFYIFWFSSLFYLYVFIYYFLSSDLSHIIVYSGSNENLSVWFKLGSLWASSDGSFLFWFYVLSMVLLFLIINNKIVLTIFFYSSFFLFNCYGEQFSVFKLDQLSSVLQDPLLSIHPPFLYLGAVLVLLFFFQDLDKILLLKILLWGILLRSYWAYYELGWGGWWFWDPVENISLVTWIIVLLILHNKEDSITKLYAHLLFIISIVSIIYVRGGFLSSVHSFSVDKSIENTLFFFLLLFFFYLLYVFMLNNVKFRVTSKKFYWVFLFVLTIFIVFLLISIFVSNVFSNVFFNHFLVIFVCFYFYIGMLHKLNFGIHYYVSLFLICLIIVGNMFVDFSFFFYLGDYVGYMVDSVVFSIFWEENMESRIQVLSGLMFTSFEYSTNVFLSNSFVFFQSSFMSKPSIYTNMWNNLYIVVPSLQGFDGCLCTVTITSGILFMWFFWFMLINNTRLVVLKNLSS